MTVLCSRSILSLHVILHQMRHLWNLCLSMFLVQLLQFQLIGVLAVCLSHPHLKFKNTKYFRGKISHSEKKIVPSPGIQKHVISRIRCCDSNQRFLFSRKNLKFPWKLCMCFLEISTGKIWFSHILFHFCNADFQIFTFLTFYLVGQFSVLESIIWPSNANRNLWKLAFFDNLKWQFFFKRVTFFFQW